MRAYFHLGVLVLALGALSCQPSGKKTSVDGLLSDAPRISSVTPHFGALAGGDKVIIAGSGFTTGASVKFGSQSAPQVTVLTWNQIEARVPASVTAGIADVTLITRAGTATNPGAYTYIDTSAPPIIAAVTPNHGSMLGKTPVSISGSSFLAEAAVTIGGRAVSDLQVVSLIEIRCKAPAAAGPGPVDVRVSTSRGSGTLPSGFTYTLPPSVVVTGLSPTSGSSAGGTVVTITGSGFVEGTTVTFGSNAATVLGVTDSSISVASPAASAVGAVTVTVANGAISQTAIPNAFTYTADTTLPVTITDFTPKTASFTINTSTLVFTVTPPTCLITGAGFSAGATVLFGAATATVLETTSTQITCSIPGPPLSTDIATRAAEISSMLNGTWVSEPVKITVSNVGGQSAASTDTFTWTLDAGQTGPGGSGGETPAGAPTILSVTPDNITLDASILAGGGAGAAISTTVAIVGANFDTTSGETTVRFGTQAATVTAVTAVLITVTPPVPANATTLLTGPVTVDVSVTTAGFPDAPAVKTGAFTYNQVSLGGLGGANPTGGSAIPQLPGGTTIPQLPGGTTLPTIPGVTGP